MSLLFNIPRGICPIHDPCGKVFAPTAGYTAHDVPSQKWKRFYRLTCSVDLIEPLTRSLLAECLPNDYYVILTGHWFGDQVDTYLSDFLPRASIEKMLAPYFSLLTHDGMVGFGFACYDSTQHEEIFIDDHKELTVLTSRPDVVEATIKSYGLNCIDDLEFIT